MESNSPPPLFSPEDRAAFKAAAAPLREWLRKLHPHHVVHVTDQRAELFEGQGVVGEQRSAFRHYQAEAHRTAGDMPARDRVFMASMGLAGEAGEVVDELKKVHFHAKPFDRAKIMRELGDVLWYLAELCTAHDLDLGEVAAANLAKLRARHGGGGFKPHAEQKRDDAAPPPTSSATFEVENTNDDPTG